MESSQVAPPESANKGTKRKRVYTQDEISRAVKKAMDKLTRANYPLPPPPTYPNPPTTAQTLAAQKRMEGYTFPGREERFAKFSEFLEKGDLKGKGEQLGALIEKYKSQDEGVTDSLTKIEDFLYPYHNARNADLGITYATRKADENISNDILTNYDALKLGKGNFEEGYSVLSVLLSSKTLGIPNKKLKELIALDDFGSIFNAIKAVAPKVMGVLGNIAKDYGIPMVKDLISKVYTESVENQEAKIPQNNNVQVPNKETLTQTNGKVIEVAGLKDPTVEADSVAKSYFCAVICPEKYSARMVGGLRLAKTALISGTATFNLTTDGNGNGMVVVIPYNAFGGSPAAPTGYGTIFAGYNPTSFVPSSGAFNTLSTIPGPLGALSANIQAYRLSSFCLRATPITSALNSQGNVQLGLFTDLNLTATNGIPYIPQSAYPLNAFYQSGNCLTSYRSVYPCNGVYDLTPATVATNNTGLDTTLYQVLITGGPANTQILKFDLSYTYEITPNPSSASLSFSDFPDVGPSTLEALVSAFTLNPGLQMLDLQQAISLCAKLQSGNLNYRRAMQVCTQFVSEVYKPRDMPIYATPMNVMGNEEGPDEISFLK